ncbi:hypothetical protein HJC23_000875 [Cyclotella cryptica]|uniref:Uncharacterized protein n=1 Tax=Cyclotella cryptica TaxID=29204 RepID=A0ABD3PT12_9STRA|eukprot:CCRYP_011585-RA/>CCRYP_011585-RA protein AED:0.00 eAED:0.00 QI:148/-1/1/1/-1/1/1/784/298
MPRITTRTLFDVRVGSMHTLEVLLQIRSSDLEWWNSNLRDHERQLYKLIGRRILPLELKHEIQTDLEREQKNEAFDSKTARKKGGVVIGEVNLKKMAENNSKSKPKTATHSKKRANQSSSSKGKSKGKKAKQNVSVSNKSAQQLSAALACRDDATNATELKDKRPKILRDSGKWIMEKSIQACYVMEDIDRTSMCSMAFRPMKQDAKHTVMTSDKENEKISPTQKVTETPLGQEENLIPLATFRSWNKLSKRLNIWVFKFDPEDPTDLSVSEGGGFPRPELLPLSDIFRQPYCERDDE